VKTILVPVDFSPVTLKLVRQASLLARNLRARVVLLTVMVTPVFTEGYAPPPEDLARVMVGQEKKVARRLAVLRAQLVRARTAVGVVIAEGEPGRQILAHARKTRAAYILIGSRGHNAAYELLLGSTTRRVIRHAPCPVMVIRASA
jgi:nucleotide-binding universal stress UspA family protein